MPILPTPEQITRRYMLERKIGLSRFAEALGINASRQMVFMWKEGKQKPSLETLFKVTQSSEAEDWARMWAGECVAVLAGVRTIEPAIELEGRR